MPFRVRVPFRVNADYLSGQTHATEEKTKEHTP